MAICRPCAQHQDRQRRYNKLWRRASAQYLREHRRCVYCKENGRDTPSQLVDHIKPLTRGGLLMDRRNWAASCHHCHNTWVQSLERGGFYLPWCGPAGEPMPPGQATRRAIVAKCSPAALKDFLGYEAWQWGGGGIRAVSVATSAFR